MIESTITDPIARSFWRTHFYSAKKGLQEEVPWSEFINKLAHSADIDITRETQHKLCLLMTTHNTSSQTDILFYNFCFGIRIQNLKFPPFSLRAFFYCFFSFLNSSFFDGVVNPTPVVTMERLQLLTSWFGPFFLPTHITTLQEMAKLQQLEWFHGNISKDVAERRLRARIDNTFLVYIFYKKLFIIYYYIVLFIIFKLYSFIFAGSIVIK